MMFVSQKPDISCDYGLAVHQESYSEVASPNTAKAFFKVCPKARITNRMETRDWRDIG